MKISRKRIYDSMHGLSTKIKLNIIAHYGNICFGLILQNRIFYFCDLGFSHNSVTSG